MQDYIPLQHECGTNLARDFGFQYALIAGGQTAGAKYERQPERWKETSEMFLK
jgi:hypothetical protein